MAVLLQYNVATSWTATQLSDATGIKMDLLLQVKDLFAHLATTLLCYATLNVSPCLFDVPGGPDTLKVQIAFIG